MAINQTNLNEEVKEEKVTVVVKAFARKKKDGTSFIAYKMQHKNRYIDLHFKRTVNMAQFDGLEMFKLTGVVNINDGETYVYPVAWVNSVDSIEKIK